MLSRKRKAEMLRELDDIAVEDRFESAGALARILAELIEAMPEEGCEDAKPGSDEERRKAWDQGHAAGFREGVRHALAASPTGLGEDSGAG